LPIHSANSLTDWPKWKRDPVEGDNLEDKHPDKSKSDGPLGDFLSQHVQSIYAPIKLKRSASHGRWHFRSVWIIGPRFV